MSYRNAGTGDRDDGDDGDGDGDDGRPNRVFSYCHLDRSAVYLGFRLCCTCRADWRIRE